MADKFSDARHEHAWLLRAEGLTYHKIGVRLGVSSARALEMIRKFGRRMRRATERSSWYFPGKPFKIYHSAITYKIAQQEHCKFLWNREGLLPREIATRLGWNYGDTTDFLRELAMLPDSGNYLTILDLQHKPKLLGAISPDAATARRHIKTLTKYAKLRKLQPGEKAIIGTINDVALKHSAEYCNTLWAYMDLNCHV